MKKQGELLHSSKRKFPGERVLSILLTLCMVLTLLPTAALATEPTEPTALAATDSTNDNYTFVASTGALTVKTNVGTTDWRRDTNIVGSGAAKDYAAVKSIVFDAAVTKIGREAFMNCTALTSLTFGADTKLTTIGDSAFMDCKNLDAVTIPASVTRIKGQAFEGCGGLRLLTFEAGSGLKTIDERAFSGCSQLGTVTIPANVTTIGGRAFYGCTGLTSLTFGAGIQLGTIPSDAFGNCKMLAAVEIPASVVAIGENAFDACGEMTSLTFEEDSQLRTINRQAFLSCKKLTTLTLPARLSYIDSDAFRGCAALTSVTFTSAKAPTMGAGVFSLSGGTPGVTLTVPADGNGYTEGDWEVYKGQFPADKQNLTPPATPGATFSFDGANAGKLMGTTAAMEYYISYRGWKPCTAADMPLPRGDIEDIGTDGIEIRVTSVGYTPSSASQIIPITKADTPTGITKLDAPGGTGGKIIGTTTAMEYSTDNFANATPCMEGATTGLLPGSYRIRVKATGTTQSSNPVYIRIDSIKIDVPVPDAGSKVYTGSTLTSDLGNPMEYTVTTNNGGINVGEYDVVLTLNSPTTHKWEGGDSNPKTIQFIIEKAAATEHLTDAPTINYTAETVATTDTMEYKAGTGAWQACTAAMQSTAFGWDGSQDVVVLFRAKNDANHEVSVAMKGLTIPARPAAPESSAFTVTKPSQGGSDGTLSGITSAMEYSTDSGAQWKDGTDAQLTGIPDGTTYTIRVKATGSAFASNTVAVIVASKAAATITFEPKSAVYTGAAQTHENATAAGDITYTYAAKADSALTAGKPQNAGSYTVTATLDTATHYGSKTVDFTITPKPVTVKADDKSMTSGGSLPVFTITYTGFVGAENENNAALTTPALASCAADGKAAGTFDILLSTLAVLNGTVGKNYNIASQTKGTLTVSTPPTGGGDAPSGSGGSGNGGSSSGGGDDDHTPTLVTELKVGGILTGNNLDRLIAGGKDLTVTGTEGAKLVFDTDALRGINDQTSGGVQVDIKDVSKEHQDSHGGKTVFSLTVTSGGKTVSDFDGKVTISLPYTLKDGEKAEDVTVWHLADDGTMTEIPATYDPKTGLATATVSHFSQYVVGVWVNPFVDVQAGDWCYDAVKFVHKNGLFSGVNDTAFAPDASMNRAMLWMVLARQDGRNTTSGSPWYEIGMRWAMETGISDGTKPMDKLTREQLITMLWRYAGSPVLMDYPGLSSFTDAGDISACAQQAMAWAHQKGLVQGSDNALNPKQNASRAQVAAILMRYCENVAQ